MVENMRATIIALGGEIRFQCTVDDSDRATATARARCAAWCSPAAKHIAADHVVLALGHSARDTFQMLHERGVYSKPSLFRSAFASSIRSR